MIDLTFHKVKKYYGAELILDDISFEIKSGERIGLIGKNGSGKTTIFKIISELENIEVGNITTRKALTIGYMEQEIKESNLNVKEYIYSGFKELAKLFQEMKVYEKKLEDINNKNLEKVLEEYGELQEKYEVLGGYTLDEKFNRVCQGIKINPDFFMRKVRDLSGGEKIKVTLARVLIQQPELLLLDEPTNHLDLDSIQWLEKFFREYPGSIIIVSHDRYFLDNVISKVFELENLTIKEYLGNYSSYIEQKREYIERQLVLYSAQQKKIKSMEEAIVRFRVWGSNGFDKAYSSAENMRKRIEKMDKVEKPKIDNKNMKMSFSKDERFGKRVIQIENLSKSFGEKNVLKKINLDMVKGEKAVIVGKNGCGKTTLLNIITGNLKEFQGTVKLHEKCNPVYITQEVTFEEEADQTLIYYTARNLEISEENARRVLAKFLFFGNDVFKKLSELSGGEKLKLKFCILTQQNVNFLVLDEPTNHLDIASRDVLENALNDFEGTILMVSHDRYFINKTANQIYELNNGSLKLYSGNYDYYLANRVISKNTEEENNETTKNFKVKDGSKSLNRFKVNEVEEKISGLEKDLERLENEMLIHSTNADKLRTIFAEKLEIEKVLESLYEDWETLHI